MSLAYSYSLEEQSGERPEAKQVKGVLSFMSEELLFEFKVYDAGGTALSTLNKFSIDLEQLAGAKFLKGFFNSELILEARQSAFFEPLPGSKQGVIKLKVNRTNREEAADFSDKLNRHLSKEKDDE